MDDVNGDMQCRNYSLPLLISSCCWSRTACQPSGTASMFDGPCNSMLSTRLVACRKDFLPGGRQWQEHPDHTFKRPTSWGPEQFWIYQVLLLRLRPKPKL